MGERREERERESERAMVRVGAYVAVLAAVVVQHAAAFTALVHYGEVRCFWDLITTPSKISVGFIVSGGFNDIGYEIRGANEKPIYHDPKVTEHEVVVAADQPGKYSYCFDNRYGSAVEKSVTFNTDIYPNEVQTASKSDSQENDALMRNIKALEEHLRELTHSQDYSEKREKAHRDTNESTNSR